MERLFKNIPLEKMNTSMTINAPAAWLLALYIATAEKQGVDKKNYPAQLRMILPKNIYQEGLIFSLLDQV